MNGAVASSVDDAKEISYNSSGTNYQHVRVRTSTERTWSGVDAAFRRRRRRPSKFSGCPSVFPALHARLVHNRPPSRKRIRNREETLVRVVRRPLARALPLGGVNHFPLSHRTAPRPLLAARPSTPVPLFSGRMMATAEGNRGTSEEGRGVGGSTCGFRRTMEADRVRVGTSRRRGVGTSRRFAKSRGG